MTLKDTMNGPEWTLWVIFAMFLIVSIVLMLGKGSNMIAGYNTLKEDEKKKYNTKKLCRVVGIGMFLISIMILICGIWMAVLPSYFSYVLLGFIGVDVVTMLVLMNTICKK